jgi:uncharacterized OB-fold protein
VGSGEGGRAVEAGVALSEDGADPLDESTGEPRLAGGRCSACGTISFPLRAACPACGGEVERFLFPRAGTLWTWTTQGFEPKPPYAGPAGEFVPYAVGYVELPGALRVEGVLTESSPDHLRIGQPMEVVAVQLGGLRTFAFAPAGKQGPA